MKNALAKWLFFKLCSKIRHGSLRVNTPDGESRIFESGSPHTAHIYAEMDVADESLFLDVLTQGDWGLGWGYVFEKWHAKPLHLVPLLFMLNEPVLRPYVRAFQRISPAMRLVIRRGDANQSREERIRRRTVSECYDVGNDFFRLMLGPSMVYTCAIWPDPYASLEQAQENKLRIITDKARIEDVHDVLDMGCGWGTLCDYIRHETGANRVKGIALAKEQIDWAKAHHPDCEFEYLNYERATGTWDRIVSVGMLEHVGRKNLVPFFELISDLLVPGGRAVIHSMQSHDGVLMASRDDRWTSFASVVMPNGDVPSMTNIVEAVLETGALRIIHTEHFGMQYARTTRAWLANVEAHRDEIIAMYSEEFYRTYVYSWNMGSVAFETGLTLGHVVLEKRPYGSSYTHSIL
jgi:cyclopropane-fatty-acyl-phospholipid synthase